MHQRQVIRDAVVAQLSNQTAAGARVKATRTEIYRDNELPAIAVYTPSEEVTDVGPTRRPRETERRLDVVIDIFAAHTEAYPAVNALDDIALQVESAIDNDPYLGGACGLDGAMLHATDLSVLDEQTRPRDPLVMVLKLTYSVPYTTVPTPRPVDVFRTADTTTRPGGAEPDNVAENIISIPQDEP